MKVCRVSQFEDFLREPASASEEKKIKKILFWMESDKKDTVKLSDFFSRDGPFITVKDVVGNLVMCLDVRSCVVLYRDQNHDCVLGNHVGGLFPIPLEQYGGDIQQLSKELMLELHTAMRWKEEQTRPRPISGKELKPVKPGNRLFMDEYQRPAHWEHDANCPVGTRGIYF